MLRLPVGPTGVESIGAGKFSMKKESNSTLVVLTEAARPFFAPVLIANGFVSRTASLRNL